MLREQVTCRCSGYSFPHREGSKQCHAKYPGPYCSACSGAAEPVQRDFGIGHYEHHGTCGIDRNIKTVSDCCEATLYEDASLTIEYRE